jgi:gluconolactonase
MRTRRVFEMGVCCAGAAIGLMVSVGQNRILWASSAQADDQAPPAQPVPAGTKLSIQAPQDPREAALLAQCKNPPPQAPPRPPGAPGGQPPPGVRSVTIIEIPGVIAAGQQWKFVWQQMGNNGDGIIGTTDGGLLTAQNDSSAVVKIDRDGKGTVVYTDTNTGGALSMNTKGALFIVERGFNPSIVELAPVRKTLADHYLGDPMDCIGGGALNDLVADSKGGAYFTMGGLFYASASGQITKYGENLHTNGIVLSPDEKILYVTNGPVVAAFDVQPDASLTNQREFGKLEGGGSGDGSTIDAAGRVYVSTGPGVQVLGPDGKYLGLIPTPRPIISAAFSGPDKKTLFILARGAADLQGNQVANAAQVYSIPMIAQGYKKRAK